MSAAFQVAVAKSYDPRGTSKDSLTESKVDRSRMGFMARMECDSYNKKINTQLSSMRQDPVMKKRVDKIATNRCEPPKTDGLAGGPKGPMIVTHKIQQKNTRNGGGSWGPLEAL